MSDLQQRKSSGFLRRWGIRLGLVTELAVAATGLGDEPVATEFTSAQPLTQPAAPSTVTHPAWSANLGMYEVNLRQFSPGGTLAEFAEHLPRLKELGVGILWFMPIHPIGQEKRKGELGSYYAVGDYRAFNPEFGTIEEFKALVDRAHELGMFVIIDWVANHTAWDSNLTRTNPEWFARDEDGHFHCRVKDWEDVIDLDYSHAPLRRYMIDSLKFWVETTGIDGFRCDVAAMVPTDFWNQAREELDAIKPVFMLAEAHEAELHEHAFDATYGWGLMKITEDIFKGTKNARHLIAHLIKNRNELPRRSIRLNFTSNHDWNSWDGTAMERYGHALRAVTALSFVLDGMPLIYSGQEAGLNKRLEFFEKDEIEWRDDPMAALYRALLELKRTNPALRHGGAGGASAVRTTSDGAVLIVRRTTADDARGVLAVFNLSPHAHWVSPEEIGPMDGYTHAVSDEPGALTPGEPVKLSPWSFRVLAK